MVSWEQVFEVVGLAYILGFLYAPLVAFSAVAYLTLYPVPSAQYLVVLVLVLAGFILAARLRSNHAKVALRTICFMLLPWSSLVALGPYA